MNGYGRSDCPDRDRRRRAPVRDRSTILASVELRGGEQIAVQNARCVRQPRVFWLVRRSRNVGANLGGSFVVEFLTHPTMDVGRRVPGVQGWLAARAAARVLGHRRVGTACSPIAEYVRARGGRHENRPRLLAYRRLCFTLGNARV